MVCVRTYVCVLCTLFTLTTDKTQTSKAYQNTWKRAAFAVAAAAGVLFCIDENWKEHGGVHTNCNRNRRSNFSKETGKNIRSCCQAILFHAMLKGVGEIPSS